MGRMKTPIAVFFLIAILFFQADAKTKEVYLSVPVLDLLQVNNEALTLKKISDMQKTLSDNNEFESCLYYLIDAALKEASALIKNEFITSAHGAWQKSLQECKGWEISTVRYEIPSIGNTYFSKYQVRQATAEPFQHVMGFESDVTAMDRLIQSYLKACVLYKK